MSTESKKPSLNLTALLAVILLGLAAYAGTIFFKEKTPSPIPAASSPNSAIIEIDFNNGKKRAFEGELGKEVYPLHLALQSVTDEGNFSLSLEGPSIKEIAGVSGPWKIYQNGAVAKGPLESLTITGGDYYVLKKE